MRVAIIFFSASSNTSTVAGRIGERLDARGVECQLVNIARHPLLYPVPDVTRFLAECLEPHDLLCVGSPVYVHHLRCDLLDLLAALPAPDTRWGTLAAAFVTFGGINSGVALAEAAHHLEAGGRRVVGGLKVNAEHTLNRMPQMSLDINHGLPAAESQPAIDAFADRLADAVAAPDAARSVSLDYQSGWQRFKDRVFLTEVFSQRHLFPQVRIDASRCQRCGACVEACPIRRLELDDTSARIANRALVCTHCGGCQLACPSGALELRGLWRVMEKALAEGAQGRGMIASTERIGTEVIL